MAKFSMSHFPKSVVICNVLKLDNYWSIELPCSLVKTNESSLVDRLVRRPITEQLSTLTRLTAMHGVCFLNIEVTCEIQGHVFSAISPDKGL